MKSSAIYSCNICLNGCNEGLPRGFLHWNILKVSFKKREHDSYLLITIFNLESISLLSLYIYIGIIILEMQLIETLNLYKVSLELSEAGEGKVMEQSTRRIVET